MKQNYELNSNSNAIYVIDNLYKNDSNEKDIDLSDRRFIPVKSNISYIEVYIFSHLQDQIEDIKNILYVNQREKNIVRTEICIFDNKSDENCKKITKNIMNDLSSLQSAFKNCIEEDKKSIYDLEKQINALKKEKEKIKILLINCKDELVKCEQDVGLQK